MTSSSQKVAHKRRLEMVVDSSSYSARVLTTSQKLLTSSFLLTAAAVLRDLR